jgi:hypothetical protein
MLPFSPSQTPNQAPSSTLSGISFIYVAFPQYKTHNSATFSTYSFICVAILAKQPNFYHSN